MLDWILNLLNIGNLLSQLTDNLILVGLTLFALALGFFAIHYLHQRRQMLHQERMATLIKGLHYAGVAQQVFAQQRRPQSRDHVMSGVRWLFGGAGVSAAVYGYQALQPTVDSAASTGTALIGLIPGALGLAHLLLAWLASRRQKKAAAAPFANRRFSNPPVTNASYRPAYRPAVGRRF